MKEVWNVLKTANNKNALLPQAKQRTNSFVGNLDLDFLEIGSKFNHGRRQKWSLYHFFFIEPESDRWLPLSLTPSLTNSVPLVDLIDWPWRVKMPTQNMLRFLLLLMLMLRIVLATVCCRFGNTGLVIKLNFCSDFEHRVWSRSWSWSSGKIWCWSLVSILLLMFCRGCEVESWSRFWC